MILSIIVAYAEDNNNRYVIGKDNTIPWHLPHDLKRFKEHTTGHAMIMGRKTFESIGKPLPNRDNIIITRQENYEVPGAHVFNNLQEALDFAGTKSPEVFIIGGQELYEQTMNKVDRMYVTHVRLEGIEGDTFFPQWPRSYFKVIQDEKVNGRTEFEVLQRTKRVENKAALVENYEDIPYNLYGGGIGI